MMELSVILGSLVSVISRIFNASFNFQSKTRQIGRHFVSLVAHFNVRTQFRFSSRGLEARSDL